MSVRGLCADGHEVNTFDYVSPDGTFTDRPIAVHGGDCELLIRLCDWCDEPGTAWALTELHDFGGPTMDTLVACDNHRGHLASEQLPACEVCDEPTEYPGEWRCLRCERLYARGLV